MNENEHKSLVCELFNLDESDIQTIDYTNAGGIAVISVLLADKNRPNCPECNCSNISIKGYQHKKIVHSVLSDRKCVIDYRARRYKCNLCGRTFYEHNPFSFGKQKLSSLTVQNVLRDLKNHNDTFSSVAQRYHISPTTAASIFDTHVEMDRLTLPEYMSWDECYAFHHPGYKSKYVCMFLDYKKASPVDILPSRRKEYLTRYLLTIPKEERNKVKMISTDMYETYRIVINEMFPKCLISVDHYHLSQEFSRKMDSIRIRIMKQYPKSSSEYYLLKKFNWLIFKRRDSEDKEGLLFDPNRERKANKTLNRYLNYYEIETLLRSINTDIDEVWELKDAFMDFYDTNDTNTAEKELNILIKRFQASGIPEVKEFARTIKNWKQEIINSFQAIYTEYTVNKDTGQVELSQRKLNNGLMENRNSILKIIKKNANGYTNWERFRNRCLYVLRKDSTAALYPMYQSKKGGSQNGS